MIENKMTDEGTSDSFNRNEKQLNFNKIRGVITHLIDAEKYCSVTLEVGHENVRPVNIVIKKIAFEDIKRKFNKGDKVFVQYYLTSREANGRWYTNANLLSINFQD